MRPRVMAGSVAKGDGTDPEPIAVRTFLEIQAPQHLFDEKLEGDFVF